MGFGRLFLLGLAGAYLVTAFVDKPAPIHFQVGAFVPGQGAALQTDAQTVLRKNVFKLGDPLSMRLLTPDASSLPDVGNWTFKGAVQPFEEERGSE